MRIESYCRHYELLLLLLLLLLKLASLLDSSDFHAPVRSMEMMESNQKVAGGELP